MTPVSDFIPVRALIALTGAVLLAHLVVLEAVPLTLGVNPPVGTRVFSTRTLQLNASSVEPDAQTVRPASAATRRNIARTARVARAPAPLLAPPDATGQAPLAEFAPPMPENVAQVTPSAATAASQPVLSDPPPENSQPPVASTAPLPKDAALEPRAYTVPGSTRLKFNATGQRDKMKYQAQGELLWLHDGDKYDARMEIGILFIGARVVSSSGRMTADGLAPIRYSDKFRSELAAHFDRNKGRVTFSANTPEAALLPGAQDQLSVFVQIAAMIAGEPHKFPVATSFAIQTVGPRAAEPWVFTVEAEEKLYLPGGELETLKLTRNPRKEFDQKVELWLAPALSYLPARIRITFANGDFVDQQWRSTATP